MTRVLVIVSGSVAVIKAPTLLRRLREGGAELSVIATNAALKFVSELSLAAAAGCKVATDESWFEASPDAQHLTLAQNDLTLVVGASADLLARAAGGHASDLASATLLSVRSKVLWAAAMNEKMWLSPAVQNNVLVLGSWGHVFIGPEFGRFGTRSEGEGIGRMTEPEQIAEAAFKALKPKQDYRGMRVVVSAGPTREYLDPVRFISNPSSGKMGFAVAIEAKERGAEVILISGAVNLPNPAGIKVIRVDSALEMREAVIKEAQNAKVVVMTAAIADYRAVQPANEKEAKVAGDISIHLTPNPDILAELGKEKGDRVLVGFAMETNAGVERAAAKAKRKNADFILLNYPTKEGTSFGGDDNQVTLVRQDGTYEEWERQSKRLVAGKILDEAAKLL